MSERWRAWRSSWGLAVAATLIVCALAALDVGLAVTAGLPLLAAVAGFVWARARTEAALRAEVMRREKAEVELRLAQKIEAVGQLAAGIAHEINNPLQYLHDNVLFIGQSVPVLAEVLAGYREVAHAVLRGGAAPLDAAKVAMQREADADVAFVLENAPAAIESAQDGLDRIAGIVRSMRAFSGAGLEPRHEVDLNDAVRNTLTLAHSQYRDIAMVETDFGELPRVLCWGGEVNQTLLALVVNAAQAISEGVKKGGAPGRITVRTRREGDEAVVSIADTGCGISPEIQHRIFDPFFTTKEVGAGVGQGLCIARQVIVERHSGALTFETRVGRGTTFFVRLPIGAPA